MYTMYELYVSRKPGRFHLYTNSHDTQKLRRYAKRWTKYARKRPWYIKKA